MTTANENSNVLLQWHRQTVNILVMMRDLVMLAIFLFI